MKGFILKSLSGDFYVLNELDNNTYICKAKGSIRNKNDNANLVCGDIVEFEHDPQANYSLITQLYPRKNKLIRPLIANVDIALIVMSTIKPSFDSYLVDKLIVAASLENIEPVILVSKCEFMTDEIKSLIDNYRLAGYQVVEVSSHENINLDKVKEIIRGKKVVLAGQSASGKSSLINSLLGDNYRLIGDFSEKLGRGKHQTREVEYVYIDRSYVADSPGFSKLDIIVELPIYAKLFKDFNRLSSQCKFDNCLHKDEPNCAVKDAVESGIIDSRRYNNYLHLMSEIKDGKHVWQKK